MQAEEELRAEQELLAEQDLRAEQELMAEQRLIVQMEQERERARVRLFRRSLKSKIEKFTTETPDPLFEISVTYNYKGGDFYVVILV
jgi:hypothetical protein